MLTDIEIAQSVTPMPVEDIAAGLRTSIGGMDWLGLVLICFVLPGVLTWLLGIPCRKAGWIKEGDLKLED